MEWTKAWTRLVEQWERGDRIFLRLLDKERRSTVGTIGPCLLLNSPAPFLICTSSGRVLELKNDQNELIDQYGLLYGWPWSEKATSAHERLRAERKYQEWLKERQII